MAILAKDGWNANARETREMAFDCFAGVSDTKRVLEDVIGALRNVAQRAKNSKMSKYHAWFEAAFAKILHPDTGGPCSDNEPAGGEPAGPCAPAGSAGGKAASRAQEEGSAPSVMVQPSDWSKNLCVPVSRMGDGMFRTQADHQLPETMGLSDLEKKKPEVPWRPAGQRRQNARTPPGGFEAGHWQLQAALGSDSAGFR